MGKPKLLTLVRPLPYGLADNAVWPQPAADTRSRGNINNVLISGSPWNFTYEVIVFDPATGGSGGAPLSPLYHLLLAH